MRSRSIGRHLIPTLLLLLATAIGASPSSAQSSLQLDRAAYRDRYANLAIEQMRLHGVPASITLAQGMLESGNGKSRLAIEGNNHFGIKCHGWQGRKMYHNDDARNECFRVYSNAQHSFEDHSLFLRGARRYGFLFDLPVTDYKAWARGLKQAGYATDPQYAERLIQIIEEEGLSAYDQGVRPEIASPTTGAQRVPLAQGESPFVIRLDGNREVYRRNRVEYVIVGAHDTYESLTRRLEMLPFELAKYNELPARELPPAGTELYIQPKRRRAEIEHSVHVAEPGETLYAIGQRYAVKTKWLRRRNHMQPGEEPVEGQLIYLRGRAPKK